MSERSSASKSELQSVPIPVTPEDFASVHSARAATEGVVIDSDGNYYGENGKLLPKKDINQLIEKAQQPSYAELLANPLLVRERRKSIDSDEVSSQPNEINGEKDTGSKSTYAEMLRTGGRIEYEKNRKKAVLDDHEAQKRGLAESSPATKEPQEASSDNKLEYNPSVDGSYKDWLNSSPFERASRRSTQSQPNQYTGSAHNTGIYNELSPVATTHLNQSGEPVPSNGKAELGKEDEPITEESIVEMAREFARQHKEMPRTLTESDVLERDWLKLLNSADQLIQQSGLEGEPANKKWDSIMLAIKVATADERKRGNSKPDLTLPPPPGTPKAPDGKNDSDTSEEKDDLKLELIGDAKSSAKNLLLAREKTAQILDNPNIPKEEKKEWRRRQRELEEAFKQLAIWGNLQDLYNVPDEKLDEYRQAIIDETKANLEKEDQRARSLENQPETNRQKAVKWLKGRWDTLQLGIAGTMTGTSGPVAMMREKLRTSQEVQKDQRRNRTALFIGAGVVALAYANQRGWIDINPFDGNGIDLNPFNGVGPEEVPAPDPTATEPPAANGGSEGAPTEPAPAPEPTEAPTPDAGGVENGAEGLGGTDTTPDNPNAPAEPGAAPSAEPAPPAAGIELEAIDNRLPWTHMTEKIGGANGTPRIMELVDIGQSHGWKFDGNNLGGGSGAILSVTTPEGVTYTDNGHINAALDYIAENYTQ